MIACKSYLPFLILNIVCQKFAGEGLRTLALAWRPLEERGFAEWKRRHQAAALALHDRDEQLDAIYEEIETDLLLIGTPTWPVGPYVSDIRSEGSCKVIRAVRIPECPRL